MQQPAPTPTPPPPAAQQLQRYYQSALRAFHAYARWLVGLSWWRFAAYAVLLIIAANIIQDLPPFTYSTTETVRMADPATLPKPPKLPPATTRKPDTSSSKEGVEIVGERDGVRYRLRMDERGISLEPEGAASAPSGSASAASAPAGLPSFRIVLPSPHSERTASTPGELSPEEAEERLNQAIEEFNQARDKAQEREQVAEEAIEAARAVREELLNEFGRGGARTKIVTHYNEVPVKLTLWFIFLSALTKLLYRGQLQAQVKAAQATEVAEAEQLKRQVVEARLAAMQAQVEPHFLFNTLASIEHLIETDAPRAAQMQRHLIALLRASMPTMREANANGVRDLGREMQVIRPYLHILQMRMEERLQVRIEVPEGLDSATFPPMMIQGLVENAIKHGLEPKAEGGELLVRAEVVHGKLAVTVADTGLGFGRAATQGTGVGLANIRERLNLLYGRAATLTVAENQPSGTVVTITVPYRSTSSDDGASA
ncbi:sensor histidine kinase [Roseateles sp. BYS180W]|uniref:histidine kinase n=1 Tax=Roseateles rivi TaxID=3299028 RepID=A0ABW7FWN2_9BURK